ncbi:signal peptide peptidase SppA [Azospirillum fermentarium]|uniref:S49 family peptidase n=1 Tax=Azospirillum fermentarium TaxID=1233114 RepID=UPI002227C983|nr:S49 family peptidase [Azospirillum fermentarium]MCW2247670.1 signal peptide peptidase SppA [Azospirillum fermentarium]
MPAFLSRLPFGPWRKREPLVSVVRLTGVIAASGGAFGRTLSMAGVAPLLEKAFAPKNQVAVVLLINSPGGSPVQSALIGRRIRDLAEEKKVPVLAFCEDVAASGGYWLACAADEIYADDSTIVGSIGVVSGGFGFHDFISRHGVERRLYTAGEHKAILDPFLPENPDDVARLKALQQEVHQFFISHVRTRRGERLKGEEGELFSGAFWSGRTAVGLGLIDGVAHMRPHLRARFGEKVRLRVVEPSRGLLSRLPFRSGDGESRLGHGIGAALPAAALNTVEERAVWGRFGL